VGGLGHLGGERKERREEGGEEKKRRRKMPKPSLFFFTSKFDLRRHPWGKKGEERLKGGLEGGRRGKGKVD